MKPVRLLAVTAAVLFLISLAFPYWTARMDAPTYPEKDLMLQIYAYKYDGDIEEWGRGWRLVGVRFPPPIPDFFFQAFPVAVIATSLLALAAAANRRLLGAAALAPWVLMGIVLVWGQYSLYLFGHDLDPERPLRFLQPFTPPVIGWVTLGKILTYHYPDVSSLLFLVGGTLLVVSAWRSGALPFLQRKA